MERTVARGPLFARLLPTLLAGFIILVVGGRAGLSKLEERDGFCISCHLAPEVTYYQRAIDAPAVSDLFDHTDLASYHYWDDPEFRCIDCHRGDHSLSHRTQVLFLAAGDTLAYLSRQFDESIEKGNVANANPNVEEWHGPERFTRKPEILNAGCFKCHQDTLTLVGFDNHFHNKLPPAIIAYEQTGRLHFPPSWPGGIDPAGLLQVEETVLTCLDCHRAHAQGFEIQYFLDEDRVVLPACVQCHQETSKGPLDLIR